MCGLLVIQEFLESIHVSRHRGTNLGRTLRQEPLQEGISLLSGCTVSRLDSLCRSK
jgi:hypothetical protein